MAVYRDIDSNVRIGGELRLPAGSFTIGNSGIVLDQATNKITATGFIGNGSELTNLSSAAMTDVLKLDGTRAMTGTLSVSNIASLTNITGKAGSNRINFYQNTTAVNSTTWIEMWGSDGSARQGELTLSGTYLSLYTGSTSSAQGTERARFTSSGLSVTGEISASTNVTGVTINASGNLQEAGVNLSTKYEPKGTLHDDRYLGLNAKAVDSDKLDNLDSTQFLRSDVNDSVEAVLDFKQPIVNSGVVSGDSTLRVLQNVGHYSMTQSAAAGAFVIDIPHDLSSTIMYKVTIEGYFYDNTAPFQMEVGFYTYSDTIRFYNYGYINTGSKVLSVRLARRISTGRPVIILGSEGGSYSYPKLWVSKVVMGHGGTNSASTAKWGMSQTTAMTDFDTVVTVPDRTYAENANNLDGLDSSKFMRTDQNTSTTGSITLGAQATGTTHAVRADRSIATGNGLIGGGNLTADRTLSVSFSGTGTANNAARSDHHHDTTYLGINAKAVDADKLDGLDSLDFVRLGVDSPSGLVSIRRSDPTYPPLHVRQTGAGDLVNFWGDSTGNTLKSSINNAGDYVGNVIGNVTGNADTATKLATARTLSLSGDVSGSVSFDGTGNVDIVSTIADDSHEHSNYHKRAGDGGVSETTDWNTLASGTYRIATSSGFNATYNQPVGAYSYGMIDVQITGESRRQIYYPHTGASDALHGNGHAIYVRTGWNSDWRPWQRFSFEGHTHPISEIVNLETELNNRLLVSGGTISGDISFSGSVTTTSQNYGLVWTAFDKEGTADWSDTAHIKHVVGSGGLTGSVLEIKSHNDAMDGVNFVVGSTDSGVRINGSKIWNASNFNPDTKLSLTGGTLTGGLIISSDAAAGSRIILRNPSTNQADVNGPDIQLIEGSGTFGTSGNYGFRFAYLPTTNIFKLQAGIDATITDVMMVDRANGNTTFDKNVTAPTFLGELSGNASSAAKLQTARTISLTGDVTGSVSFDGTANTSMTVTVGNSAKLENLSASQFLRSDAVGTSSRMTSFYTTMSSQDDWQNSPISIMERDKIGTASADDKYAPNLNFHWTGRLSRSLVMKSNGDLYWGEYDSSGTPPSSKIWHSGNFNPDTKLALVGGTMTGNLTINKSNPWLTLHSPTTGANGVEQAAGISIGENGEKGNASLHITYTGDGYSHIGMGTAGSTTSIPTYEAMRLYYTNRNVEFLGHAVLTNAPTSDNHAVRKSYVDDTMVKLANNAFHANDPYTRYPGGVSYFGLVGANASGFPSYGTVETYRGVGDATSFAYQIWTSSSIYSVDRRIRRPRAVHQTVWSANTAMSANTVRMPSTGKENGFYYIASVAGTTTATEPTWPGTSGATVKDLEGTTTWIASTAYAANALVVPTTVGSFYYKCTTAGTSGTTQPAWPTTAGATVTDGSVVWTAMGIVTWTAHGFWSGWMRMSVEDQDGDLNIKRYLYLDGARLYSESAVAVLTASGNAQQVQMSSLLASSSYSDSSKVPADGAYIKGSIFSDGDLRIPSISFHAPPGDPSPTITARTIPTDQGGSNEKTELILFHSNDPKNASGEDMITLRSPAIRLQTYNNTAVNSIANAAGSVDRLVIDSLGNVGIGTSSPGYKLDVSGDVRSTGTVTGAHLVTNGNLYFNNNMLISNDGGASNIDHIWHDDGGAGSHEVIGTWHFVSDNTAKSHGNAGMRFGSFYAASTGYNNYIGSKLGIGVTSPAEKLDVSGNIKASGVVFGASGDFRGTSAESYFSKGTYADPHPGVGYAVKISQGIAADSVYVSGTATATTFSGALSGNASSATKLATARTISLIGDVSGSVSFDGTGDVSITATVADNSHTHSVTNLTWAPSENLTTSATMNGSEWSIDLRPGTYTGTYWHVWTEKLGASALRVDTDTGLVSAKYNLSVTGTLNATSTVTAPTFSGALSGNASTATKLATARTISIVGDGTGSASFDGSGDASISLGVTRIQSPDNRNTNLAPNARSNGIYADFKANTATGLADGGGYHGLVTYRPYSGGDDFSGGGVHQLGFTINGNMWYRYGGTATTWNGWQKFYHTGNLSPVTTGNDQSTGTNFTVKGTAYIGDNTTTGDLIVRGTSGATTIHLDGNASGKVSATNVKAYISGAGDTDFAGTMKANAIQVNSTAVVTNLNAEMLSGTKEIDLTKNQTILDDVGYGIYSGLQPSQTSPPSGNIALSAGVVYTDSGRRVEIPAQSVGMPPASGTYDYWAILYVRGKESNANEGNLQIAQGTPTANPVEPALPAGAIPIAKVRILTNPQYGVTVTDGSTADRSSPMTDIRSWRPIRISGDNSTLIVDKSLKIGGDIHEKGSTLESKYARLAVGNSFTGNQDILGRVWIKTTGTLGGSATSGNYTLRVGDVSNYIAMDNNEILATTDLNIRSATAMHIQARSGRIELQSSVRAAENAKTLTIPAGATSVIWTHNYGAATYAVNVTSNSFARHVRWTSKVSNSVVIEIDDVYDEDILVDCILIGY